MTRWDESPELLPPTIVPRRCGCSRQPCRMPGHLASSRARSAAPSVCSGCEFSSSDVSIPTRPELLPVSVKLLQLQQHHHQTASLLLSLRRLRRTIITLFKDVWAAVTMTTDVCDGPGCRCVLTADKQLLYMLRASTVGHVC